MFVPQTRVAEYFICHLAEICLPKLYNNVIKRDSSIWYLICKHFDMCNKLYKLL